MNLLLKPWTVVIPSLRHSLASFENILDKGENKNLILSLVGVIIFWHIYTPIHELLHVAGCLLGGGTVESLALKPQYGGSLLKHIFPFIVDESDYAGQLTGFTTPNYWVYALVDYFPYLLSLFGLSLMEWSGKKAQPLLFGLAVILTYVPFLSITGDYYEAPSLITTQLAHVLYPEQPANFLVSDDLFRSIGQLRQADLLTLPLILLLVLGMIFSIFSAMLTLAFQTLIAKKLVGFQLPKSKQNQGGPQAA